MNFSLNSEYKKINSVLLHLPGPQIESVDDPKSILFNDSINYKKLITEYDLIKKTFHKLNIEVLFIEHDDIKLFNMMFCRDLLFMTPLGAIISRMYPDIRKKETLFLKKTLIKHNIPILSEIEFPATLEGADCLWIDDDEVIIGVGKRTDILAFKQIKKILNRFKIKCYSVPQTQEKTQHLLGTLQIVDYKKAIIRDEIINQNVILFLKDKGFTLYNIPEIDEVRFKQSMNTVTVAPNSIVMPKNCPKTESFYIKYGIQIVGKINIDEITKGAGGLACATSILSRNK